MTRSLDAILVTVLVVMCIIAAGLAYDAAPKEPTVSLTALDATQ